jgi:hypothetical protein
MSAPSKAAPDRFTEAEIVIYLALPPPMQRFGGDADRADRWMRSDQTALGMRHPEHVCTEPGGLEACLAALANDPGAGRSHERRHGRLRGGGAGGCNPSARRVAAVRR